VITLSLLHPIKQIPVQVWTFPNETTIRIGRSTDNQVILYSAVVSRHHVELRRVGSNWEIVNLGTNGTYLDGKRITQMPVTDGAIIRLARSGPNIQIRIGEGAVQHPPKTLEGDQTIGQRSDHPAVPTDITDYSDNAGNAGVAVEKEAANLDIKAGTIPVPPHLQLPPDAPNGFAASIPPPQSLMATASHPDSRLTPTVGCRHPRGGLLFCVDCGYPLQVVQTVADYQLLKVLGEGEVGITYQAWRSGQHLVLKTLNTRWANNAKARDALECEAETLRHLNHPYLPHLLDFFSIADQPYLVMEMISGLNLAQHISAQGPASQEQAIAWVIDLCRILEYLHNFTPPIVHRGIKPQSLIRQSRPHSSGALALVDFGAIKAIALSHVNPPVGSSGYNAPEQLDMDATPALDLYALGPLLVYLVTGQNPISFYFDREQGYRLYAESVPNITPELAEVIDTLTEPRPEHRYATATEVIDVLKELALKH
jgi:serine/threonine-protein kinase